MTIAGPVQIVDVRPFGQKLADATTTNLAKSRHLEITRLVIRAGEAKPAYMAPGEVVLQCVEGRVLVTVFGEDHELTAGQLMYLPAETSHALKGQEDASLLLTVLLYEDPTASRLSETARRHSERAKGVDNDQAGSTGAHG